MSPPNVRSGPQAGKPESRNHDSTAAAAKQGRSACSVTDDAPTSRHAGCVVPVAADLLATAADLIGSQHEREHAAERRGFDRGHRQGRAEGYEAGYLRACAEVKQVNAGLVGALELDLRRWPPAGRAAYGRPRRDDYPGGQFAMEHAGQVWLAGPVVHRGGGCTDACRAIAPGWYSAAQAASVLRTLPHDYADEIARLGGPAEVAA